VCDPLRRRASARGLRWRLSARTPTPGPAHGGPLVRGTPSNHLCEAGAHVRRQGGRGGRGARGAELGSHSRQIQPVGEPQAQHHMVEQLLMRTVRRLLAACKPRRAHTRRHRLLCVGAWPRAACSLQNRLQGGWQGVPA